MLILDDLEWTAATASKFGLSPTSLVCTYCARKLEYPIMLTHDRNNNVYHARCALALESELSVDIGKLTHHLLEKTRPNVSMRMIFEEAERQGGQSNQQQT